MANRLVKQRRLEADSWKVLALNEGDDPAGVRLPVGPLLVPLAVWQARKACLIACEYEHGWPLGVWLAPHDDPAAIAADLDDFTVIGVHFPKFTDGRGYSIARLLRERYGYQSELRAFGDVGRDQIFLLNRVGFDSFLIGHGRNAEEALAAFNDFPEVYQAGADLPEPLFRRRAA